MTVALDHGDTRFVAAPSAEVTPPIPGELPFYETQRLDGSRQTGLWPTTVDWYPCCGRWMPYWTRMWAPKRRAWEGLRRRFDVVSALPLPPWTQTLALESIRRQHCDGWRELDPKDAERLLTDMEGGTVERIRDPETGEIMFADHWIEIPDCRVSVRRPPKSGRADPARPSRRLGRVLHRMAQGRRAATLAQESDAATTERNDARGDTAARPGPGAC